MTMKFIPHFNSFAFISNKKQNRNKQKSILKLSTDLIQLIGRKRAKRTKSKKKKKQ